MKENQENLNPLLNAQRQIKSACDTLELDPAVYEILKQPQRLVEVAIPVRMDDGSIKVFTGYRSQHNDAVGPTKGGLRFHPDVTREEVMALSIWMTFKCSVTGIPYGGGKGGIIVDPKQLSKGELERLSRGYIGAVHKIIGEKMDVPAPDVNTNGQIMSWMVDEYNKLTGQNALGALTGKPLEFGGSQGRTAATGYGLALTVKYAARKMGLDMTTAKVAVQGFGNVASYGALFCQEMGAKIVAIFKSDCILYKEDGFDIKELMVYNEANGSIRTYPDATSITAEEFWALDVEILLPCALENAITEEIAHTIKAKLIAEGANGPITANADEILNEKGVVIIPDILANAGGVTVSYFEWVQNLYGHYWSEEKVLRRAKRAIRAAFHAVYDTMEEYKVPMRTAAYVHSIKKIANVMKLRGWY